MIICLFQAAIGALITAIWDDGDENTILLNDMGMSEDEYIGWMLMHKVGIIDSLVTGETQMDFPTALLVAEEMIRRIGYSPDAIDNEIVRIRNVYDKHGHYHSTPAEKDYVRSVYGDLNQVDYEVSIKTPTIFDSIDPAEDGDAEGGDSFSFETEIENLFSLEPMAISHEDIQAETDIIDPSSVDPIDEITVDEEISVDDTTTGVFSEVSVTEETYFQEAVIYPDVGDEDLDRTNDVEELFAPEDEYRPQEEIEGRIEFMEQVLDDAIENLDANTFEAHARTFYQDDSEPLMMEDDVYFPEDINSSGVIDFSNLLDDVGGIVTDLVDDTFNDPFLQWLESPGSESLDIDPAPGFMSPYGVLGGF